MPCRDGSLIVGGRSGCIGCPCAIATPDLNDPRLVRAALLAFGAPLFLLLLSAAGTAALAANQPAWALVGLVPLLGIAAGGHGGIRKALLASTLRQSHHSHHSHRRNDR